ncbi:hypothetical protein SK128_000479, partial [Halocaridina rubra]
MKSISDSDVSQDVNYISLPNTDKRCSIKGENIDCVPDVSLTMKSISDSDVSQDVNYISLPNTDKRCSSKGEKIECVPDERLTLSQERKVTDKVYGRRKATKMILRQLNEYYTISGAAREKCFFCGTFVNIKNMMSHLLHHDYPSFSCTICKLKYFDKRRFLVHMYSHLKIYPYNCLKCSKTFKRKDGIIRHLIHCHGVRFTCPVCDREFTAAYRVGQHIRENHPGCMTSGKESLKLVNFQPVHATSENNSSVHDFHPAQVTSRDDSSEEINQDIEKVDMYDLDDTYPEPGKSDCHENRLNLISSQEEMCSLNTIENGKTFVCSQERGLQNTQNMFSDSKSQGIHVSVHEHQNVHQGVMLFLNSPENDSFQILPSVAILDNDKCHVINENINIDPYPYSVAQTSDYQAMSNDRVTLLEANSLLQQHVSGSPLNQVQIHTFCDALSLFHSSSDSEMTLSDKNPSLLTVRKSTTKPVHKFVPPDPLRAPVQDLRE